MVIIVSCLEWPRKKGVVLGLLDHWTMWKILEQRDNSTNEVNGAPDQVADSVHSQQESGNLLL